MKLRNLFPLGYEKLIEMDLSEWKEKKEYIDAIMMNKNEGYIPRMVFILIYEESQEDQQEKIIESLTETNQKQCWLCKGMFDIDEMDIPDPEEGVEPLCQDCQINCVY